MKFGPLSTRYRDIFDLYWLVTEGKLDKKLISDYMKILIFDTDIEINNKEDISNIIDLVLSDNMFIQNLSNNNNWTGQGIAKILETIKKYVAEL